jgi:hypothetical protein
MPYKKNEPCPWGNIQSRLLVVEGIEFLTTASHGGFVLSEDRYSQMPEYLKPCSFTGDQYFEEDSSWCAVVLAFTQHFSTEQVKSATDCYTRYYIKKGVA